MFGRFVLAVAAAILGEPFSECVLQSALHAEGFVWSQLFVVVCVA